METSQYLWAFSASSVLSFERSQLQAFSASSVLSFKRSQHWALSALSALSFERSQLQALSASSAHSVELSQLRALSALSALSFERSLLRVFSYLDVRTTSNFFHCAMLEFRAEQKRFWGAASKADVIFPSFIFSCWTPAKIRDFDAESSQNPVIFLVTSCSLLGQRAQRLKGILNDWSLTTLVFAAETLQELLERTRATFFPSSNSLHVWWFQHFLTVLWLESKEKRFFLPSSDAFSYTTSNRLWA